MMSVLHMVVRVSAVSVGAMSVIAMSVIATTGAHWRLRVFVVLAVVRHHAVAEDGLVG